MCGTILWYWYVNYMPNQTCGTTTRVDLKAELTLSNMLRNRQIHFKNLAVFTPQDFKSMFGHFLTLCIKS